MITSWTARPCFTRDGEHFAGDDMDKQDTGYQVRNEETESELPRLDGLTCTPPTHHGLINTHGIHRLSLFRVPSCGGVR